MSPTLTTFLFEAANFLVLAAVLGWLFFKPVRKALQDQRAALEVQSRAADEKLAAAEQTRAEAEAQREAFRDELVKLRAETLDAARQEAARILAQAREQVARQKQAADQHVWHLEQAQMSMLASAVAAAAGSLVGELLGRLTGNDLKSGLLNAACSQLRELDLDSTPVTVESAGPLSDEEQARLVAALGPAASGATYRVVPDLGSGIRITTSRGLIDASTAGLKEFAQQALAADLKNRTPQGGGHGV